jgi:SHS2 domain-containing protein
MVEVYGRTMPELFTNAAFCVADLVYRPELLKERRVLYVVLDAPCLAELLMEWLRELLYCFSVHRFAVHRVTIARLTERHLEASLWGEHFDPVRHGLKVEIKTPTYHNYRLEPEPGGFRATVVFDA